MHAYKRSLPQSLRIALFLFCFPFSSANAFTLNGTDQELKGWDTKTLTFHVNTANCSVTDANLRTALSDAIGLRNAVPTSDLKLQIGADTTTTGPNAYNGLASDDGPVIGCDTAFTTTTGEDGAVLGLGRIATSNSSHRIAYGAILLNSEAGTEGDVGASSAASLASTIAHEMGHVLGLGHSEDTKALMYYANGRSQIRLGQDDMDGITFLYPRKEFSGDKPYGCATVSAGSPPPPPSSGLFLGAFFLMAYFVTRKNSGHTRRRSLRIFNRPTSV